MSSTTPPIASITLSDTVDVFLRNGTARTNKVSQIKHRPPYSVVTDFYKPLRDFLVQAHQNGDRRQVLAQLLPTISDPKKRSNYPAVIDGYRRWWGNKQLTWFQPPRTHYSAYGIDVTVNPELGLEINGTPFIIKLHLKQDRLDKARAELVHSLLEHSLRPISPAGAIMCVLDARKGRLITQSAVTLPKAFIDAELAYIAALWPSV